MGKVAWYAAATVGIAGIIHLMLVPMVWDRFLPAAALFLAAGVAQLFWIIPSLKGWPRYWLYIGIGGNAALMALWAITRVPNPITGMALPINVLDIATQIMQGAYIGLASYLLGIAEKGRVRSEGRAEGEEGKMGAERRGSPIQ
ncbi:MAG: hypothetical protein RMJ59_05605 [Candidatus Nitrosocaldus sp.]|nr:hypothetical protein [Candidatus Nitrosocaldus sp.]MDW8275838.1 hypothetical protein [Candidatus Nitrosocaldus sp.]